MQPVSGSNYYRASGTAAGTTTIAARGCTLDAVMMGQTKTGTITVYDSVSGTNALLLTTMNNTSGSIPSTIHIGAALRNGLTITLGGTCDALILWH
jgi:hypothetical protein